MYHKGPAHLFNNFKLTFLIHLHFGHASLLLQWVRIAFFETISFLIFFPIHSSKLVIRNGFDFIFSITLLPIISFQTSLHCASYSGCQDVVILLIERGMDVNIRNVSIFRFTFSLTNLSFLEGDLFPFGFLLLYLTDF
jgi:hypothetical protein